MTMVNNVNIIIYVDMKYVERRGNRHERALTVSEIYPEGAHEEHFLPCPRTGVGGLEQSYLPRCVGLLNSKLAHAFT